MFVEMHVKALAQPLKDVDVRKSASALTALANEKQKEQRDKASGKKKPKAASKPALAGTRTVGRFVFPSSFAIAPRNVSNFLDNASEPSFLIFIEWMLAHTVKLWMTSEMMISCRCAVCRCISTTILNKLHLTPHPRHHLRHSLHHQQLQ